MSYFNIHVSGQSALLTSGRPTAHTFSIDVPGTFVRGTVTDEETGAPLPAVAVRLVNTPLVSMTDRDGRFAFERIPLGDYNLRVEHISYATVTSLLNVRGEALEATVRLAPEAIPLAPITVTAFSRRLDRVGFYEREKRGVGTFIGRRQIDAMNVLNASDLLRGVPSTRLIPQITRRNVPPNLARGRGNCRYRYIVDGARTLPDFEIDFVPPSAIEGLEVYRGLAEVPALFRSIVGPDGSAAHCGVIAIWTRDSR